MRMRRSTVELRARLNIFYIELVITWSLMLTNNDLSQFGEVVDKKIENRFKVELKPIKEDIAHIRKDTKTVINYFGIEAHLNLSVS